MNNSKNVIKKLSFKEHAQKRSMWIGSDLLVENTYWILEDNKFIKKNINISDALIKAFDEILVNAVDQYMRAINTSADNGGPVSIIKINFSETGEISVYNNGQGIPVHFMEDIGKYSVEVIMTEAYSGSNFDDDENPDRIVGGVNGLGMKVINARSMLFEIETVDWERKIYYKQSCENKSDIINKAIVIPLDKKGSKKDNKKDNKKDGEKDGEKEIGQQIPHTCIRFIPDYAGLCKINNNKDNPDYQNKQNLVNFMKIIETRIYQTAAFISCINYRYENGQKIEYNKKAKIYFNDKEIKIHNLTEFVKLFGVDNLIEFEMSGKDNEENPVKFPWTVCIGYANSKDIGGLSMSIINGVFLPKGGSHINMLYNQIKNSLQPHIELVTKGSAIEFKDSMLKKLLFIVDARNIPLPQFSGQTKDSISIGTKDLNIMKKTYSIPDKVSLKVWKMIKDAFEYKILQQDLAKSSKKRKVTHIRKYEKAEKLGINSGLFIPEGDSAALPIRNILTSKKSPISRKNHGMYNIQGVPPNACKKTKEIIIDGEIKIKQDKDLQNNISLQGLASVLNLDYNCTYYYGSKNDKSEEHKKGDKEFNTLNYGYIVISTDQDLDGIGNICSLIIVYILVFWPELIKRGFIRRLQTPLIRVYMPANSKKINILEFYSQREYKEWVSEKYINEELMPEKVKKGVNYYKGLGGHTKDEVSNMGETIYDNIITLTWDDIIKIKMKLYYGQDTGDRKDVLLTPVLVNYTRKMMENLEIPVSMHFDVESKAFQLYFMRRKLKNAVDGMIPSQRKAFAGARIMFRKESKAKVYQLTGYITKKMHYQHGDTSMNETIIKMAQNFTGANNIPMFIPISNGFGDRVDGRGVAASPRYIDTKYNTVMDLIFPPIDDWLLEYVYEDGSQSEPVNYIPIIPYSILETSTTTGVGWKIGVWAREYKWTIFNLIQMINNDNTQYENSYPMGFLAKLWLPENMRITLGTTRNSKNISEICLGEYSIDGDNVIITQLPLKVWSHNFKCSLLGINPKTGKTENKEGERYPYKDLVIDVIDNTGNDQNDIVVKLKPGAINYINENYGNQYIDPIEDYLGIYQILSTHLNMMGVNESVVEFNSYEEVMRYWYTIRKMAYIKRLERQIILLELRIKYNEEILRFIYMDEKKEINIDKKNKEERERILDEHFIKFNKTNLLTPKYIKTELLNDYILKYDASYKYIYDITKGMTDEDSINEMVSKISDMKEELEKLKKTTWKTVWLNEIENLNKVINNGIKTGWLFGTKQYEFKKTKNIKR